MIFLFSWWPEWAWFETSVWGTVSDWFMFVATVVTARYLYLTFQSQLKIQKIANYEFLKSNAPEFDFIINNYEIQENHEVIDLSVEYTLKNGDCKISRIFHTSAKKYFPINIPDAFSIDGVMQKDSQGEIILPPIVGPRHFIAIHYSDMIGNNFKQLCILTLMRERDPKIKILRPEVDYSNSNIYKKIRGTVTKLAKALWVNPLKKNNTF